MRLMTLAIVCMLTFAMQTAMANGTSADWQPSSKGHITAASGKTKSPKTIRRKISSTYLTMHYYEPMKVTIYSGSLRNNIIRLGNNFGWHTVVWNSPEDYLWIGTTQIVGNNLQTILNKILIKYPLQAQFYQGNHVLAIVPRNLP